MIPSTLLMKYGQFYMTLQLLSNMHALFYSIIHNADLIMNT